MAEVWSQKVRHLVLSTTTIATRSGPPKHLFPAYLHKLWLDLLQVPQLHLDFGLLTWPRRTAEGGGSKSEAMGVVKPGSSGSLASPPPPHASVPLQLASGHLAGRSTFAAAAEVSQGCFRLNTGRCIALMPANMLRQRSVAARLPLRSPGLQNTRARRNLFP